MKKAILMTMLMVCMVAGSAMGQMAGLPVADDAGRGNAGEKTISGGLVVEDEVTLFGGRLTYNASDVLSLFGGAGIVEPEEGDSGWAVQGGGILALSLDMPIDVAVRGTLGYVNMDQGSAEIDMVTLNGGLLGSKEIEILTLYGLLGLNYARTEVSIGSASDTDTETDPALGGGVILSLTPQVSVYAEAIHIDELWLGVGGRLSF